MELGDKTQESLGREKHVSSVCVYVRARAHTHTREYIVNRCACVNTAMLTGAVRVMRNRNRMA